MYGANLAAKVWKKTVAAKKMEKKMSLGLWKGGRKEGAPQSGTGQDTGGEESRTAEPCGTVYLASSLMKPLR